MADTPPNLLETARAYLRRGYMPVPVPAGVKGPRLKGWQRLRLTESELPAHFGNGGNIGLLLGEPSGGLIDVDLDCDEARALAPQYLPETPSKSGRRSAPNSHWWYIVDGAIAPKQYRDPQTNRMIVELRGTGQQTLVGPSIHVSGEAYDMLDGEPAGVDAATLASAVAALAESILRARHGDAPNGGHRGPTVGPLVATPAPPADAVERRAAAYLDAMPPAISGQGGHNATYAAATALVHGFELAPNAALRLLLERYNPRCKPPWSEKELRHKVENAAEKPHDRPRGWLLESGAAADIDLSGFKPTGTKDAPGRTERPPAPGPFPDHLLKVPGLIGDVIAYNLATATRPQPVLALAGAICLQAVLAARKVRDERGNRTNVYCINVADSGAGKDHARKVNKHILFQADLNHLEGNEDLASDAGLVTAVEAEPAILFQFDEFGRFLRTIGDPKRAPHLFNVLGALMKLYSSADIVFRGKAYADKKRNRTVDQPCVCMYGTTVAEHFFESLTAESLSDGFIARLLVFETETTPPRQRARLTDVPEPILEAARWWGAFKPGGNLRAEHPEPCEIFYTEEAGAIFDRMAALVDAEMSNPDSDGRSLWARAEEKACRLALIYACSVARDAPVIDGSATQWACELSEYLTRRMLHVAHEWVADGQFDARQKRVLRVIRGVGGSISRSELCRRTQWLSQRERLEVINNMLETAQIVVRSTPTATKPKVEYVIA